MNEGKPQREELDLDAPEKLEDALKQLHIRRLTVPPEVDAEVLRAAREHLQKGALEAPDAIPAPRQPSPAPAFWEELRTGWGLWLAARRWAVTASVIVAGALVWLAVHARGPGSVEDLNRDGVVDMLDAFALARQLEQGRAPRLQWDVNGDGVVDERDVQALAARAVSLESGGRS
jgi:hypothetical protein